MNINKLKIQDVCEFVGGSQPPKEVFSNVPKDGYVRLIQIRDYKTDGFITYIPQELARRFCDEKDIMIGRYGPPIFQICRGLKGAYNVALMKAIPKKNILNDYLYYFLKQNSLFEYIDSLSLRTGGQTGVDIECLKKYPIHLPALNYQEKVVKVLSSLDDKIEINNRINSELENLAKTIYDYWFVQFDFPDENGKPYKSSGGKMVYNQELKREIPAGWEVKSLWNIANYFNGLPMQNNRPINENYLRVIKIKEMNEGFSENTELARADIPIEAIVEDGDILFSWSATLDVKMWSRGKGALNQHIFKVTSNKFPKTFYYYELKNYLNHFKMMAERRKTTMGHITQDHLKQSRIVIPPHELISQVHNMIIPMFEKQLLLEKQNQQLTQLRDWLLPMLMNGQITVK
ncbi:MAG: restriction endonuclease subunit S [Dolichospermum sp.]